MDTEIHTTKPSLQENYCTIPENGLEREAFAFQTAHIAKKRKMCPWIKIPQGRVRGYFDE